MVQYKSVRYGQAMFMDTPEDRFVEDIGDQRKENWVLHSWNISPEGAIIALYTKSTATAGDLETAVGI